MTRTASLGLGLVLLPLAGLLLQPVAEPAQEVEGPNLGRGISVRIQPDSVRVGEPFVLRITADIPPDLQLLLPDTLASGPDLESIQGVKRETRSMGEDLVHWTAEYSLVAWRPGHVQLPRIRLSPRGGQGAGFVGDTPNPTVSTGSVKVASVLPSGGLALQPKGPLGPVEKNLGLWPLVPGLALFGGGLAGMVRRRNRRSLGRGPTPSDRPATGIENAKQAALRGVEEVLEGPLPPAVASSRVVEDLTRILRSFLHEAHPQLPPGHTTRELVEGLRGLLPPDLLDTLQHILGATDRVRYGGEELEGEEARWLARGVHHWIRESSAFFREGAHG